MEVVDRKFLDTPTRSVHAATIEFWDDKPVIAWFGGYREGSEDVSIYINNLHGEDELTILGSKDGMPRWNPILFAYDDRLHLFEKAGVFCDRWQTFIHDTTEWDTYTPEKQMRAECYTLPAGMNGPVKTKPVLDHVGNIVCGSAVETFSDWSSYFEYFSIKDGKWEILGRTNPIAVDKKVSYVQNGRSGVSLGIIQPALWLEPVDDECEKSNLDGINAFFRSSNGLPNLYYAYMKDEKVHGPFKTNLLNPNSGIDVVKHNDRLFLVSNPSSTLRNPLVVQEIKKISDTEWEVVDEVVVRESIEEKDHRSCISQELSYPYMVENDDKLHLVYTYGRSKIEHVVISL